MTEAQKRVYVADLYSGPHWKKKVEKMPDDQVTAIYLKHLSDGERPHHVEPEESEPMAEPLIHVAPPMHGPHANEDQFPIY